MRKYNRCQVCNRMFQDNPPPGWVGEDESWFCEEHALSFIREKMSDVIRNLDPSILAEAMRDRIQELDDELDS